MKRKAGAAMMSLVRALSPVLVLATVASSALSAPPAPNGNPNPGIIPPNAHYAGSTYGEWLAGLNEWILEVPAAENLILLGNEDKIAAGQPRQVWFLANAQPVVDRHFTVPAGKALFASIFAVEVDNF